jgi:cyclin-dependent kinase
MKSLKFSGKFVPASLFLSFSSPDLDRLLGTPDENTWPGVSSFPDFKPSFPKWRRNMNTPLVSGLEPAGLELLEMLLEYDPARRISAKQACAHPYFAQGSEYYSGRTRVR